MHSTVVNEMLHTDAIESLELSLSAFEGVS
jgi:hypothetical protein